MLAFDEHHKYARDCLRWTARALTEEQRKQFLSLAHDWRQAALLIEDDPVPSDPDQNLTGTARGE
jgi:hypothetical protein